jgi:hypothetical protein
MPECPKITTESTNSLLKQQKYTPKTTIVNLGGICFLDRIAINTKFAKKKQYRI